MKQAMRAEAAGNSGNWRLYFRSEKEPTDEQKGRFELRRAFSRLPSEHHPIPKELACFWSASAEDLSSAQNLEQELIDAGLASRGEVDTITTRCSESKPTEGTLELGDQRHRQHHLHARHHDGIDVFHAWKYAGGKGEGVRVVDLELGPRPSHPDLPKIEQWGARKSCSDTDHAIPVLGLLCAKDDGHGIVGIVPRARVAIATTRPADPLFHPFNLLRHVVTRCELPAVVLVEITLSDKSLDELPLEAFSIGRAVLRYAVEQGVYPVVAAGNRGNWLDLRTIDKDCRPELDSQAILVGARRARSRARCDDSNFGMRVDVSSWGEALFTCGSKIAESGCHARPIAEFGKTSGAAAVVAGAVASLAGIVRASFAEPLLPAEMRELLVTSGYCPIRGIGPHPDLREAIRRLARERDLIPAPPCNSGVHR